MLFTLKKITGSLLLPLPLLLLVMAAGIFLLWFSRWQKSGKMLVSCSWLMLLLLSLQPVADFLLSPLESRYPAWQGRQPVEYVVVLGGSYTWNPQWVPSANLLNNSLPRVTEGIRLWRDNPGAKIIFTGAAVRSKLPSSAAVAAQVAQSLGVPARDIIILDKPRDTSQEAIAVAQRIGQAPFLLVTSASHLPRAMIFFRQRGLHPLPAPAGQSAITSPLHSWQRILPASLWLEHSERAWYESLGRLWQSLTLPATSVAQPDKPEAQALLQGQQH